MGKILSNVFYQWSLPWHNNPIMLGVEFIPTTSMLFIDNKTKEEITKEHAMISIGIIVIRIDIIF